jgi:hypothetical protein
MRNRLFWIGFAIAATIDICNSLNYYYPSVPPLLTTGSGKIPLDLHSFFVNKPWSAIGWTPVTFYPFVVGIGMLMPMDFLFSSWFFYIFWKMEAVETVAMAWDGDPRMPYANYQALGGYIMFFVASIVLSKSYLVQVLRRAVGLPSQVDDSDEPMRYRWVLVWLVVGLAALVAFSTVLGLKWWLGCAFVFLYFVIALAITRMRAEMGTPVHDLHFTGPDWALTDLLGPRSIGPQGLAVFSLFFWFNRAYRAHPMPVQLEGMKMAQLTAPARAMRTWVAAMMIAGFVGIVSAFWAILHLTYIHGNPLFGGEPWGRLTGWLNAPRPANMSVLWAVGVGFVCAGLLQVARTTTVWWPFHPLAYAVSGSWEMNLIWFPLFFAWLVKLVILRFGGGRAYSASLPFFYGLILGEFIPGSLLNIWGLATNNPTYQFWQ